MYFEETETALNFTELIMDNFSFTYPAFTSEKISLTDSTLTTDSIVTNLLELKALTPGTGGSVLKSYPTTTEKTHTLRVYANEVTVDADSTIDLTGTGYPAGYTIGNDGLPTTDGASTGSAGGSYGGYGNAGANNGYVNFEYGDETLANNLGSGSGDKSASGSGGQWYRSWRRFTSSSDSFSKSRRQYNSRWSLW